MRYFVVFQLFMVFLVVGFSAKATDFGDYVWGPPHQDSVRPYLEEAKLPQNSRWQDDQWTPQDWIDSRGGSASAVIDGFYEAGILTDQYLDDDVPILEVGQTFLELGAQDKRRVVAFIDEVFGITKFHPTPVILIYFHEDDLHVGEFNAGGLQLQ